MNNSKLAHNWANKIKENGKGSSMFYYGDTIYSYGYHFPIAKFVTVNDKTFIAFNCQSYSNTTSKHQLHVRRAIPYNYEVINCIDLNFNSFSHINNLNYYKKQITSFFDKAKRSIKYKNSELSTAYKYGNNLFKYVSLFDIVKLNIKQYNEIINEVNTLLSEIENYENSDIYKTWIANQEKKKIEAEKKALIYQAENILKFRSFEVNHVYSLPYNLLRYNQDKDIVQTSGGVDMAKDIFLKYYDKFINNQLKVGDKVQHFQYGGNVDNIVFVGCHKFEISEIENLINSIPC